MQPCRVLIIEDDPMVAEVNRQFVEAAGPFQVVATARTGREGVELVALLRPDLVVLDIYLPDQDGVETLKQIRRLDLDTDVIVVSAAQDARTIQEVLRHGAVDYIIKPFKFARLRQTLQAYARIRAWLAGMGSLSQEELDRLAPGLAMAARAVQPPEPKPGLGAMAARATQPPPLPSGPAVPRPPEPPAPARAAPEVAASDSRQPERAELPKGLSEWTLRQVLLYLTHQGRPLSAGEVAAGTGLARVTVRRYLEYLVQQGHLRVELHYGPVGRPLYRYSLR